MRLAQGVSNRIDGTNTIFFEKKYAVPKGKKVTYGRLVCDIKEHKSETHRTRLTVGGNLLDFPGMLSTPTETVTTTEYLFNSVIFTPGAKCLVADVKIFYLNNDLPDPKYMKLQLHIIPQEIINQYSLHDLVEKDGWVYLKITKGMYGLNQAGIIASMELTKHFNTFGYYPVQHTPGLWRQFSPSSSTTLQLNMQHIKTPTISYKPFTPSTPFPQIGKHLCT